MKSSHHHAPNLPYYRVESRTLKEPENCCCLRRFRLQLTLEFIGVNLGLSCPLETAPGQAFRPAQRLLSHHRQCLGRKLNRNNLVRSFTLLIFWILFFYRPFHRQQFPAPFISLQVPKPSQPLYNLHLFESESTEEVQNALANGNNGSRFFYVIIIRIINPCFV